MKVESQIQQMHTNPMLTWIQKYFSAKQNFM